MKKILLTLLLGTLFIPNFVIAQTASSMLTSAQVAELIAQLQAQVKELQAQLVAIQQSSGVEVTSTPEFVAVNEFTQTLSRGMESEEVKELQRLLAQNPEIYPEGVISGYFGALTEQAVRRFQEANGLPPVGIVGPKTRAILNETVSSGSGGSSAVQNVETIAVAPATSPPPPAVSAPALQAVTPPPPSLATSGGGGGTYQIPTGYYGGVQTYVSEPTPPPPPPSPSSSSTTTASTTPPAPPPPPPPSPSPTPPPPPPPPPPATDTTGPTITSLSITPASTVPAGAVSFTATAEDPSGIQTIIYNIHYPGSGYVLRPNCNYNGVTSGTCAFGESIDHGIQNPSLLGDYVIDIRIVDLLGNSAYYYSDGTVTGGVNATHSLTIPAVTISAP